MYATIILFLLNSPSKISNLIPELTKNEKRIYEIHADIIKKEIKTNSKVFIVAEDSSGEFQFFVKYYANPIITNMKDFNWSTSEDTDYE